VSGRRGAAARVAVSLACLAAVGVWVSRQDAPDLPTGRDAVLLLLGALGLYALATVLRGERWHRILRRQGIPVTRADSQGLTLVGYMGNNVLPARAGDVMRVAMLARRVGGILPAAVGSAVADRLLDALALVVLLAAVLAAGGRLEGAPSDLPLWPAWVLAGVLALAVAGLVAARRRGALGGLRRRAGEVLAATRELASRHGAALLGASVVIWLLEAAVYLAVARAAGLPMGIAGAVQLVVLVNLVGLLPAGPGYLGTFDAAVLVGAGAVVTATGAELLAYLLLLRAVLFVPITLAGAAVLLARARARLPRPEAAAPSMRRA
jgi:glycosyltransferase 2 family protein